MKTLKVKDPALILGHPLPQFREKINLKFGQNPLVMHTVARAPHLIMKRRV
jgi:hypothetical protein